MNRKRLVIIGVAVGALLLTLLVIYLVTPKTKLLFSVAPDEVSISIGGKEQTVKSGQKVTVSPGEVVVTISRSEFTSHTETVQVEEGKEVEVLVALTPTSDAARRLLNTQNSQNVIQRIANREMEKAANDLAKTYPIVSSLPIKDKYFLINICRSKEHPDDSSKIAICIYLYETQAETSARKEVERRGYNLDDYESYIIDETYSSHEDPHHTH